MNPRFASLLKPNRTSPWLTQVRKHWNKDFKPGKYPKTIEERRAAAAKYNMHIDDYEPYPDDGCGFGDYPKLPDISDASKDNFYAWDYPELKRNFNEPIHVDCDLIGEDRYDLDQYYTLRPSFDVQLAQFLAACTLFGALMWVFEKCPMFPAVTPKQFPHQGKHHFTFEPCKLD